MYSTNNERKSVDAERFIRALKSRFYKIENVYFDKLDDIVNKYNNPYHRTIRKKPTDVQPKKND